MADSWSYDGSTGLSDTFTPENGTSVWYFSVDFEGYFGPFGPFASSTNVPLTLAGALSGTGEFFNAFRIADDPSTGTYFAASLFKEGTSGDLSGTVSFSTPVYDGDTTVTAVIHSSNASYKYGISADDPDSSITMTAGNGGDLTVSVNDVGGLSPGDTFIVQVRIETVGGSHRAYAGDFLNGDSTFTFGETEDPSFIGPVRVGIAFNDVALEENPTWVHITDGSSRVASYTIDRGRQFEFDKTDAGTATVAVNDRDGTLDPTNSTGPYFGLIEPLLQIKIDLWNPVALEYQTRFRGWIEDYDYVVEPFTHQDVDGNTVGLTRLEINCVDIFEILTAIEMTSSPYSGTPDGSFGDDPTTASYADATGNVFFAVTDGQGRVDQVMGNAGIPVDFYVCFTLNVDVAEAVYSPSENVLQVIQDVADAEFPTVANVYTDRFGRLAIHGRLAKFDPSGTAIGADWEFTHWKAGDAKAVHVSPSDTAHIREFSYNRGLSMIRNAALCTPNHIDDPETTPGISDIPGQYVSDPTSIDLYGIRSWSAENLFVEDGILTGNNALDECLAFANFIIANYAEPRNRITDVTFKAIHPDAEGAAANWDLLCRADISDLMDITIRGPGDSDTSYIFNAEPFFIEGVHEEATPATGEYAMVTMSLDLSPQAYFTTGAGVT